ncbi:MAG TPA: ATP-binding protein [Longimicrobiales bacterium]
MSATSRGWLPATTLGMRIALPAGLFTLAGIGLLSFTLIREQRQQMQGEVIAGSESIAEAILLSLDHDMRGNQREGVDSLIAALGRHADIAYIRIFNKDGSISFSSLKGEVGKRVNKQSPACVECHRLQRQALRELTAENRARVFEDRNGNTVLGTIYVIPNREGCAGAECHAALGEQSVLGVLDVGFSLEQEHARVAAATRKAVLTSVAAAALITLILFVIISQNHMIRTLGSSKQRLEEWARVLEQQVETEAEELRQAHYQVMQAEKLSSVGLVAAGIAHELNSPLMAIITFSHLVRSTLPGESPAQDDLRMIEREANRCALIIRQLLDYSRKQTAEPETNPCGIGQIVQGALELLKVEQKNTGVAVHVNIDRDLPLVDVNDLQLMQVFMNLMLNALQAMPNGGELTVTASHVERRLYDYLELPPHSSPDLVRVTVRDTGSGITRDNLNRVFDPFFTTKPVGKGSGLGLSVSLGLVQRYHGTILVDSDGASWTEFTVLLPACNQPALVGV